MTSPIETPTIFGIYNPYINVERTGTFSEAQDLVHHFGRSIDIYHADGTPYGTISHYGKWFPAPSNRKAVRSFVRDTHAYNAKSP